VRRDYVLDGLPVRQVQRAGPHREPQVACAEHDKPEPLPAGVEPLQVRMAPRHTGSFSQPSPPAASWMLRLCPQTHRTVTRGRRVLAASDMDSCGPSHRPSVRVMCTYSTYGKSSRCPSSQTTRKRAGTRVRRFGRRVVACRWQCACTYLARSGRRP
jgi:hypothetical protein